MLLLLPASGLASQSAVSQPRHNPTVPIVSRAPNTLLADFGALGTHCRLYRLYLNCLSPGHVQRVCPQLSSSLAAMPLSSSSTDLNYGARVMRGVALGGAGVTLAVDSTICLCELL